MNIFNPYLLLPLTRLLVICCIAPVLLRSTKGADEISPKPSATETACGVWSVPPDIMSRRVADGDAGADTSDAFPKGRADAKTAHKKTYDRIIPALGSELPLDARPVLASLGVTFREGDLALVDLHGHNPALLFVRASPDQIDLVDDIVEGMGLGGDFPYAEVCITLRRCHADGPQENLIRRSLLCPTGQRAKFERRRARRLVEKEEIEVTIGEDGVIDLNAALEFHIEKRTIKVNASSLLRSDAPYGVVLHTARDKASRGTLEVVASGRILFPIDSNSQEVALAKAIDEQIKKLSTPVISQECRSDLFWVPELDASSQFHSGGDSSGERNEKAVKLSLFSIGQDLLIDAGLRLKAMKVPLAEGDETWYAPKSGLLYVHAGDAVQNAISSFQRDPTLGDGPRQMEVRLNSWKEKPGKAGIRNFPPRSLLVRSGHRAMSGVRDRQSAEETIEVEATACAWNLNAALNVSLDAFDMGGETWTVNMQAAVPTDGLSPITLISGMAKDSGGKMKHLTVSAKLRYHQSIELVRDPERKARAIAEFESALRKR